jgi:hypothetical protein
MNLFTQEEVSVVRNRPAQGRERERERERLMRKMFVKIASERGE